MHRTNGTVVVAGLIAAVALLAGFASAPERAGAAFPGGNGKIAFTSDRDGNDEIYVMNADGSGQTRVTDNPAFDADPAWAPNGDKMRI